MENQAVVESDGVINVPSTSKHAEDVGGHKDSNIAKETDMKSNTSDTLPLTEILEPEVVTQNVSYGESEEDTGSGWEDVSSDNGDAASGSKKAASGSEETSSEEKEAAFDMRDKNGNQETVSNAEQSLFSSYEEFLSGLDEEFFSGFVEELISYEEENLTSSGEQENISDGEEECTADIGKRNIYPSRGNYIGESNRGDAFSVNEISALGDIFNDSEDFSEIVNSAAFIDKTLLIKTLFYKPFYKYMKTVLITAPRRCGKSVNLNMVKCFLEIEVNDRGKQKNSVKWDGKTGLWLEEDNMTEKFKLFKERNLKIYQCRCESKHTEDEMKMGMCPCRQFFYEHCGQYPVVFLNFQMLDCSTWNSLFTSYKSLLKNSFRHFQYLQQSDKLSSYEKVYFKDFLDGEKLLGLSEQQICDGLETLVSYLYHHFGKKPVLLIDEFDAPFIELMHLKRRGDMIYRNLKFIKKIVISVMKGNENLFGCLMNATEVSSKQLSEHAKEIKKCAFLESQVFSKFYGLTKQDLNDLLQRSEFKGCTEENILELYNGGCVSEDKFKVYSVYSLLKYIENWML